MMEQNREDRSLGELFRELSREVVALVRKEMELGKVEMTSKATQAGKNAAVLAIGGAVLYTGFLSLVGAAILLLGSFIGYWQSALIVGLAVSVTGLVLMAVGKKRLRSGSLKPQETVDELKDRKEWLKEQMT
jgi:VIT1/CCC1 family predicted Fe2+/Mn2+ transporter